MRLGNDLSRQDFSKAPPIFFFFFFFKPSGGWVKKQLKLPHLHASVSNYPDGPVVFLFFYRQAIETTCNELHVQWQKEYFGAW